MKNDAEAVKSNFRVPKVDLPVSEINLWIYLVSTHLLLGCCDPLVFDSLVTFSEASSSSGCCTSRWMWLGEEGQGEGPEDPWAGELCEEEEEPL